MGRDNSEIDSVMFFGIRNHNYRTLQVFESKTILVHNTGTLLMITKTNVVYYFCLA